MSLKTIFGVVLLFQISFYAAAQQDTIVLRPGNKLVNGTVIKTYTNKWKVTLFNTKNETTPNGIWTDYGQLITLEGKTYFHRVQDLYDPNMNLKDTWINMVEHKTLIPVSFSRINPKGGFSYYQFEGNIIKGSTNLNTKEGKIKEINENVKEKVFDWNLYGILLAGLPLKKGFIAKLPFYNAQANALQWLVIHVKAPEVMALPGNKKIKAWKIETNQNLIFWISNKAPYVIKLELDLKNNGKLVWETF